MKRIEIEEKSSLCVHAKKKDVISRRTSVRACAHRDMKLRVTITYLR